MPPRHGAGRRPPRARSPARRAARRKGSRKRRPGHAQADPGARPGQPLDRAPDALTMPHPVIWFSARSRAAGKSLNRPIRSARGIQSGSALQVFGNAASVSDLPTIRSGRGDHLSQMTETVCFQRRRLKSGKVVAYSRRNLGASQARVWRGPSGVKCHTKRIQSRSTPAPDGSLGTDWTWRRGCQGVNGCSTRFSRSLP